MTAIEIKNLTKKFNDFTAVDSVSFDIQEGEFEKLGQILRANSLTSVGDLLKALGNGRVNIIRQQLANNTSDIVNKVGDSVEESYLESKMVGPAGFEPGT